MKVRLLTHVKGMGQKGDIIEVSEGQARNMLLPKKMAEAVTAQVLNQKKMEDAAKVKAKEHEQEVQKKRYEVLHGKTIHIHGVVSPQETLYQSVTKKMIAEEIIHTCKLTVKQDDILLPEPIHKVGVTKVDVQCGPSLKATIHVEVK